MQRTRTIGRFLLTPLALLLFTAALPAQDREPVTVFAARRDALRQKLSGGLTVLFAYGNDSGPDSLLPFRQENNFYYLTGFDYPGAVLLLAPPPPPANGRPSRSLDEAQFRNSTLPPDRIRRRRPDSDPAR